jgi:hypothetical protein
MLSVALPGRFRQWLVLWGGGGGNTTVVNIYLDGAVQNTITVNGREDIENIANEAAKIVANNIRKSLENRI